jgi:hypothetical protein
MLIPKVDLNKPGVKRLEQVGVFAVIANKNSMTEANRRSAVVNTKDRLLDSIHENYGEALSHTRTLMDRQKENG